jgi:hypothetical protein
MSEARDDGIISTPHPSPVPPGPPGDDPQRDDPQPQAPHRGQMVMVMGILSLVLGGIGLILGPIAWIMGRNDLREMDAGRMDGSGRSNTNIGRICGMIATLLQCTALVCCVGKFVFMGIMFTSAVGSAQQHQSQFQKQFETNMQKAQADQQKAMADAIRKQKEREELARQALEKNRDPRPPVEKRPNTDPPPPIEPDDRAPGQIDLMPLIDVTRDVVKGKWQKAGNVLRCEDQHFAPRVTIRYEPPAEYDFMIQFSQPALRHPVAAIMPNPQGGSFICQVGLRDGNDCRFMAKKNKDTKAANVIKPNTTHTMVVQIRRNVIRCLLDNKELIRRKPDYADLTIDGWNKIPEPRFLGVACDDPTVFYAIQVVEINAPGKRR